MLIEGLLELGQRKKVQLEVKWRGLFYSQDIVLLYLKVYIMHVIYKFLNYIATYLS